MLAICVLCAVHSDAKSWEPWFFTAVPHCPQAEAPNIIRMQRKGVQINLIRDAPFPEPSFICLSKVPVNEPPPSSPTGSSMERVAFSRAFFYVSLEFLNKKFF
jgi:hypothetical protein